MIMGELSRVAHNTYVCRHSLPRENPQSISKISIKWILEVEKHRELYDPKQQFYEDNVDKDQRWDIANAMFIMKDRGQNEINK